MSPCGMLFQDIPTAQRDCWMLPMNDVPCTYQTNWNLMVVPGRLNCADRSAKWCPVFWNLQNGVFHTVLFTTDQGDRSHSLGCELGI